MTSIRSLDLPAALEKKARLLTEHLQALGSVIVAYSGGVDSSLLAFCARQVLGEAAKIVIALSPSLAQAELLAARMQAEQFHFDLMEIATQEVDLEHYRRNDGMRCFFCKSTLFEQLQQMKEKLSVNAIAYGANMDDLNDVRPGHQAAAQYNVVAPLLQSGLYKAEIRALARASGLPSHDRPQAACLSSRFPQNVYIDQERLALVDKAEESIHALGFRQVRVRFKESFEASAQSLLEANPQTAPDYMLRLTQPGPFASVEIGEDEMNVFESRPEIAALIEDTLQQFGFTRVFIDRRGYQQGGADS